MGQAGSMQIVESYLYRTGLGSGPVRRMAELVADGTLRRRAESVRNAFPDLHVTIRRVVAQDDLVAVHLIGSGTQNPMHRTRSNSERVT